MFTSIAKRIVLKIFLPAHQSHRACKKFNFGWYSKSHTTQGHKLEPARKIVLGYQNIFGESTMISSAQSKSVATRYVAVEGFDGRSNDIIYVGAKRNVSREGPRQTLVFFGGDVQDYPENMLAHRDNHRFVEWNLESTAATLSESFPEHDVMVIRCSRMYLKTFACYENFVSCNDIGVPQSNNNKDAHRHLIELVRRTYELLAVAGTPVAESVVASNDGVSMPPPSDTGAHVDSELVLVGFSKGCVVLNQMVREIHELGRAKTESMGQLVRRIKDIYWLDGGHSGGSDVWITEADVLRSLAETEIRLHVHVTPYQMEDQRRPWIRREEKQFTYALRKMNAEISRVFHFSDEGPSIEFHFKILRAFRSPRQTI